MTSRLLRPHLTASVVLLVLGSIAGACSTDSSGKDASGGSAGASENAGGSSTGGAGGDEGTVATGEPETSGVFPIALVPELVVDGITNPAHTSISGGSVNSGPAVPLLFWEVAATSEGCSLLKPYAPFCETDCGAQVCVADDLCRAAPTKMDAGTITITGVNTTAGGSEFPLTNVQASYSTSTSLAYPPAAEGATITLASDGIAVNPSWAPLEAFSIQARGIAPLVLTSGTVVPLERDVDTVLTWEPPTDPSESRIFVEVDISHHGGQKGQIDCIVPDTGSLTIPATIVTGLINLGVAGYPDIKIKRRSAGATQTSVGRVELRIDSQLTLPVEIPGLISCHSDTTAATATGLCPAEQSCNLELRVCE